ncbi:HXXEE domain-containing protein [Xiamenia xianingshaonis]|uniref:HXXEE domain-containing protein n=1 Tax=Xiamenia xianingshaonis TaxID=2682776 RepID=A0ABX0IM02_9ACTN|nr:HXXEE domain-containing protein [Xiamenia xianingshaonis]NHM15057.1 HXXEE domain-containing protein [Xiamenia xianingshaonis]
MAEGKKRTLLDWWCGKPWLYATYALGVAMLVALVLNWESWSVPQRLMGILCVLLPLHVFEELEWPDGFQFMMNKVIQKSDNPLAYPENRLTDMITNFGAEILFIAMLVFTPIAGNMFVVFMAFFGIGETIAHTVFTAASLRCYRAAGMRAPYTPGLATAWCTLLPVGIASLHWLITSGTFAVGDLWGILFVMFLIGFMIRLPFIISYKIKSTRFAYDSMGYFAKFEK